MTTKGLFIAIEGTDGSGKSTQAKLLSDRLQATGHKVHYTFEPTDGHIGKLLRSILKGEKSVCQESIAALFLADRLDHLLNPVNGIVKLLAEGFIVISDRYYFSSYAYHSVYVDMEWVMACNSKCAAILRPHLNLFIDVTPEVSMNRIQANREVPELYETTEILTKVRNNYLRAIDLTRTEESVTTVDGNRPIAEVADEIYNIAISLHQG